MKVIIHRSNESSHEEIMEKQRKSEILGKEVEDRVYSILSSLPPKLTEHDLFKFSDACTEIDKIIRDSFDQAKELGIRDSYIWRRLLMPFHKCGWGWESAYGEGFTWDLFFNDILSEGCTEVKLYNIGILFSNSAGKSSFNISLVKED